MTEAVRQNSSGQQPPPPCQARSQDSWGQRESSYSDRSINERDFLGDVDYEWLCGYGCRGGARVPPSALKMEPELADATLYNQISYHVDATLAEVDMEDFIRGDIHRILEISGYADEMYEDEKEQSSPLFSSTRDQAVFNNISMDSLDCSSYEGAAETIAQSCRTNMNNYTIAFEASMTSSGNELNFPAVDNVPGHGNPALHHQSAGPMTTWSEQRTQPAPGGGTAVSLDAQSKSMPDALLAGPLPGSVLVYDVNQSSQIRDENSGSLFKMFIRQKHDQQLHSSSYGQSSSELLTAHSDSCSDCPMKSESESEPSGDTRAPTRLTLNDPVTPGPYRGVKMPVRGGPLRGKSDSGGSYEASSGRGRPVQREQPMLGATSRAVDHCIQTSASLATANRSPTDPPKPSLYICYPHYSMPNLQFLSDCPIQASVHLCPQPTPPTAPPLRGPSAMGRRRSRRPYSCNDAEALRTSNLSHIRDWGSLQMLLPDQFRQVVEELGYCADEGTRVPAPVSRLHGGQCGSFRQKMSPPQPCPHVQASGPHTSTGADPPLTESQLKGILRRAGPARTDRQCSACAKTARHSLQEPLQLWLHGAANFAESNAIDLEHIAKTPLSDSGEAGKAKRVSFSDSHREYENAEVEETKAEPRMRLVFGDRSEPVVKSRTPSPSHPKRVIIVEKESFKGLLEPLIRAVNEIVGFFQSGSSPPPKPDVTGDSGRRPAGGYLVLDRLCPALYHILSHGLLTTLDTAFGQVPNCGWRIVESVTSLGTCPQALQDLVMKLNNEEGLSEGVLKFNAFIFGLLNTQSLDSWFSYLRTRESIIRKHYSPEGLLYHANCAARWEYDTLILQLQRMSQLQFNIDLMFESKMLYQSLGRLGERLEGMVGSWNRPDSGARRRPRLGRPRSTVDAVEVQGGEASRGDKKRWSGLDLSSKLLQALDAILTESSSPEGDDNEDDDDEDFERDDRGDDKLRDENDGGVLDDVKEESGEELEDDENVEKEEAQTLTQLPTSPPPMTAQGFTPQDAELKVKPRSRLRHSPYGERSSNITAATSAAAPPSGGALPKQIHKFRAQPAPKTNKAKFQKLQQQWETMAKGQTPSRRESRIPRPVSAGARTSPAVEATARRPSQIPKPRSAGAYGRGAVGESNVSGLKRRTARGDTRLLSPKEEKDEENRAKGVNRHSASNARSRESRPKHDTEASAADDKQTKRVRSLSHYHASDRSYLSYNRHELMNVVGVVDKDWLLCARNERVGLVARKNVVDVL